MKKTIYPVIIASLVLSMLLTIQLNIGYAQAEVEGLEINLTDDMLIQAKPAIYGNRVVWTENFKENGIKNYEIFLYDLSIDSDNDTVPNYLENSTTGGRPVPDPAKIRITNNASEQENPDIYADIIVWEDKRHGNYDIYMYDLAEDTDSDGLPNYLDDNDDGDDIPDESDSDGDPAEIRITDNPRHQEKPAVYGTKVVWVDNRYGNKDISVYDMITGKEAILGGLNETGIPYPPDNPDRLIFPMQNDPKIYGDKVVWVDERYSIGSWEICMYNLSVDSDGDGVPNYLDDDRPYPDPAEERITSTPEPEFNPSIYGDQITYVRSDDVFLYDIRTKTEYRLTEGNPEQKIDAKLSSIYGTKVVWAYDVGYKDVYLYDLAMDSDDDGEPNYRDSDTTSPDPAIIRITNASETISMIPKIYTNKIVWQDNRNLSKLSDSDIYIYTLTQNLPPEITYSMPNYTSEIDENESISFSVNASDPEGEELIYSWFFNEAHLLGEDTDVFEFVSDYASAGVYEVKVVVSDGEHPVEKIWLIYIAESGIDPLEIMRIDPLTNPSIVEGGEITLSIRFRYMGSGEPIITWDVPDDPTLGAQIVNNNALFAPLLDYNGSNDIKRFKITVEITDGKYTISHTWLLTVLYFNDADMDGYSDSVEIAWKPSDPLNISSVPLDTDRDLIVDTEDNDKDGDGFLDKYDVHPLDPNKQLDGRSDYSVEILIIIITLIVVIFAVVIVPRISKS